MKFDELPEIFDAPALAKYLGITQNTAYRLTRQESFPAMKIGRLVKISKDGFAVWLRERAKESAYAPQGPYGPRKRR